MLKSVFHANGTSEAQSDDTLRFMKSLKELKELRSQIHKAADYCEKSYLKSEDKIAVLDSTREYLCKAVVTVVDHLGCVTANLNRGIEKADRVSEAEVRINCLKQKLDSCDQYNHNFTLTKVCWSKDLPRYHPRYISPPSDSSCNEIAVNLRLREPNQPTGTARASKQEFKNDEDMPLYMFTSSRKICLDSNTNSPLVIPALEGLSIAPKLVRNPSFHFQDVRKPGGIRRLLHWKSINNSEIMSLIRRSKKEPSKLLKLKS